MDTYNLLYDEVHKKIVQLCKKHFLYELASLASIRERVIMVDTRRDLEAIASSNMAFIGEEKSNTQRLMVNNNKLAKNLQDSRKEIEQLYAMSHNATFAQVHLEEMKAAIRNEVSTLGETMQDLHDELVTVHKVVFHVLGLQQQCKDFVKTLRNV